MATAPVIHTETTCEVPFPRRDVWPIMSKTDWINRAVGLPPVRYEVKPLPEGGSAVTARAKFFGMELQWQEIPFEWLEDDFYCVHRIFERGPFIEGRMGVDLRESVAGITSVRAFSDFTAKSRFGVWLVRNILGPKTNRGMEEIIRHVADYLRGQKPVAMPHLAKKPVSEAALQAGLTKLRPLAPQEDLVAKLETTLRESPDVELTHIRPFSMARSWGCDRWDVVRLFLQATRCGLLNFSWEVLCPNCRSTRLPSATALNQVHKSSHCEVCQIKFDGEFDKSVELKFSVNPNVRPCDSQTFCLAGPGGKPHIFGQLMVGPGQNRSWKLPRAHPSFRLRSPQVTEPFIVAGVDASGAGSALRIKCLPEQFEVEPGPKNDAGAPIHFENPNSFTVQLAFESVDWSEDILTAAQVTNWQEFRDLFDAEVISPNEQITVGSQIILFTDLRGSTAMYNGIGDAPAYVVVRDHFTVLTDAIRDHHGAIVKTIGDAVMAVFSRVDEALSAVQQMHKGLQGALRTRGLPAPVMLKSSLHIGPCLAVNANDKLDYFGTTVNLAARLDGCCQGNDLTISDELYSRPETAQFLKEIGKSASPSEVKFRGFEKLHKVWRIPMV